MVLFSLSLFVLQLSLSLVLHPINQILCLEELRGTATTAVHDHHHDGVVSHSHSEPEGETLQHCKDVLYGVALTPMQAFSLPSAVILPVLNIARTDVLQEFHSMIEHALPPPVQPPRA